MLTFNGVHAATAEPELILDPGFNDPASWNVGTGSSFVDNGHLVVINHTGFIFSVPAIETIIGQTYQYSLIVDVVNNLSGGGKVTVGENIIWQPDSGSGTFTGTVVAAGTGGLVFNFLTPYTGRAEFSFISVSAVPVPATVWLLSSALTGLAGLSKSRKIVRSV